MVSPYYQSLSQLWSSSNLQRWIEEKHKPWGTPRIRMQNMKPPLPWSFGEYFGQDDCCEPSEISAKLLLELPFHVVFSQYRFDMIMKQNLGCSTYLVGFLHVT